MNALAAIAAAEHVGVPPAGAAKALSSFRNVRRRMELRGEVERAGGLLRVYDDFAHHPTAIRTTLDGLRRKLDGEQRQHERILAVFEPRSNTMKLGTMAAQLPWSLASADLAFCHTAGLEWGRRRRAGAAGRARASGRRDRAAGGAGGGRRAGQRPHRLHEQRRFRRRARQAARRTAGRSLTMARARQLIETLQLQRHPEGGWFREVFRSSAAVSPADGRPPRSALTSIYFLLEAGQHSRWHRVRSDEVWLHLEGVPLALWHCDAGLRTVPAHVRLGPVDPHGTRPQQVVPAGQWQAARPLAAHSSGDYTLAACAVGPASSSPTSP